MKVLNSSNEIFIERHGNNCEKFYEGSNEKLWNDQVALLTFYEKEHSRYEKEKHRKHLWEAFHKTCGLIHIVL